MNFELEFPYANDTVYLAYSQPYTYSQILAHMFEIENKLEAFASNKDQSQKAEEDVDAEVQFRRKITRNAIIYERSLLCTTICGLPVPKISITANQSRLSGVGVKIANRKVIFVTARVHPGETNASTVFEGFLNSLIGQVEFSQVLANYIIKLVPCMNPDGVVCGNYRSSLAGVDLNRQWILPSKNLHPEVYYTKALMRRIAKVENKKILIYCDIHCHSKKKNSFLYGCNTAHEGATFSTWTQVRLLPRLLARRSQYISLPSCRFGIDACKLGTARVVVWKEFKVMNSFTLENSFYGYDYGPETRLYTQEIYREIGAGLAHTLDDYRICLAQIQQELLAQKGWLKPIKLKEITGTPAAEIIAKEFKEERKQRKIREYIKRYESRMGREGAQPVVKGLLIPLQPSQEMLPQLITKQQSTPTLRKFSKSRLTTGPKDITEALIARKKGSQQSSKLKNSITKPPTGLSVEKPSHSQQSIENESSNDNFEEEGERKVTKTGKTKKDTSQQIKEKESRVPKFRDSIYTLMGKSDSGMDLKSLNATLQQEDATYQRMESYTRTAQVQISSVQRQSSMMMIQQSVSNDSEEDSEVADVVEENNALKTSIQDEKRPSTSPKVVRNWRQLFDQAELNEAYKQSIIASKKELKGGSIFGIQGVRILQKGEKAGNEKPYCENEEQKKKSSDNESSDDSASVDNLRQTELYSKVYMHKNKAIKRKMRQTTRAQENFIHEVKIMITKKDEDLEPKVTDQSNLPLERNLHSSSKTMKKTFNSLGSNIDDPNSGADLLAPVVLDSRSNADLALILTGVHIENIRRNLKRKKPFSSVKVTPRDKRRSDVFLSSNLRKSIRPIEGKAVGEFSAFERSTSIDVNSVKLSTKAAGNLAKQQKLSIQPGQPTNFTDRLHLNLQKSIVTSFQEQEQDYTDGVSSSKRLDGILTHTQLPAQSQKAANQMSYPLALKASLSSPVQKRASANRQNQRQARREIRKTIHLSDSQEIVYHKPNEPSSKKREYVLSVPIKNNLEESIEMKIEHIQLDRNQNAEFPKEQIARENFVPLGQKQYILRTPAQAVEAKAKKQISANRENLGSGKIKKGSRLVGPLHSTTSKKNILPISETVQIIQIHKKRLQSRSDRLPEQQQYRQQSGAKFPKWVESSDHQNSINSLVDTLTTQTMMPYQDQIEVEPAEKKVYQKIMTLNNIFGKNLTPIESRPTTHQQSIQAQAEVNDEIVPTAQLEEHVSDHFEQEKIDEKLKQVYLATTGIKEQNRMAQNTPNTIVAQEDYDIDNQDETEYGAGQTFAGSVKQSHQFRKRKEKSQNSFQHNTDDQPPPLIQIFQNKLNQNQIHQITVKTREPVIQQSPHKKQKDFMNRKQPKENVERPPWKVVESTEVSFEGGRENLSPVPNSSFLNQEMKKLTGQLQPQNYQYHQTTNVKSTLILQTHDKERYKSFRFRRSILENPNQSFPESSLANKRLSLGSEAYQSDQDNQNLKISDSVQFSAKFQIQNQGQDVELNQFQKYIQSNLQGMQNKAVRDAYAQQIEINQKNRKLISQATSGSVGTSSIQSTRDGEKRDIFSLRDKNSIIESGGLQLKLGFKRQSIQPLSKIQEQQSLNRSGQGSKHLERSEQKKMLISGDIRDTVRVPMNSVNNDFKQDLLKQQSSSSRVSLHRPMDQDLLNHYGQDSGQKSLDYTLEQIFNKQGTSSRQVVFGLHLDNNQLPKIARTTDQSRITLTETTPSKVKAYSIHQKSAKDVASLNRLSVADLAVIGGLNNAQEQSSLASIEMQQVANDDTSPHRNKLRFKRPKADFFTKIQSGPQPQFTYFGNDVSQRSNLKLKSLLSQESFLVQGPLSSALKSQAPQTTVNELQRLFEESPSIERLPPLLPTSHKALNVQDNQQQQYTVKLANNRGLLANQKKHGPNAKSLHLSRKSSPTFDSMIMSMRRKQE